MSEASDESPMLFHGNSSKQTNIRVTLDGTVARRLDCTFFTRGLVFGNRPIKIGEKICFKLMEIAQNLGGFVYVGFTSRDPETLKGVTCQSLAKDSGFWSWFFPKDLCSLNCVLFYYVTIEGVVKYGAESVEKGAFPGVVKLNQPLWPLFDIFGNSSAIRLVPPALRPKPRPNRRLLPFQIHKTHSPSLLIDANVLRRLDNRYSQGYAFSHRPIRSNETVFLQIAPNQTGPFKGCVHLGVTSSDPALLSHDDLPDNVNRLVDRPEYWVLICDFSKLNCGDEIALTLAKDGPIRFSLNGGKFKGVVHVDATLKLYVFVNVYGTSQSVHLLTCPEQVKVEEKECVVCLDSVIETALYRCGHTCMCFECAVEQWQGKGGGHCPLCRAVIKDVIRINK